MQLIMFHMLVAGGVSYRAAVGLTGGKMRTDNRLSRTLHVLIHMSESEGPMTSAMMGLMLDTNAVVVRRTMSGLRDKGCVQASKGHSGGWILLKPLSGITLLDVYEALGEPPALALGLAHDDPACLVEQTINVALDGAFRAATDALRSHLRNTTLAQLRDGYKARLEAHQLDHGESMDALAPHSAK
jgi:DNA-binding IscR family transcriptional regulator